VSNRGGDFTSVYARHEFSLTPAQGEALYGDERASDRTSPVGKAAMVKRSMVICAVLDSIGLCKIPALTLVNEFDLVSEADLVSVVVGMPVTPDDLFVIGERIVDIERLCNMRFGAESVDDTLPAFFLEEPLLEGAVAGSTIDLESMIGEFYEAMGWSTEGVPTVSTLRRLGLQDYSADA
jgi:aldehyde:ferredoxin oxidoreductase